MDTTYLNPLPPLSKLTVFELADLHHGEYLAAAHIHPPAIQAARDRRVGAIEAEATRRGVNLAAEWEARRRYEPTGRQ